MREFGSSQNSPRVLQEKLLNASKQGNITCLNTVLSDKAVNADHVGQGGKTALYHAITQKHIVAVKALLHHGVDVEQTSFATYHRYHSGVQLTSSDEPPLVTAARVNDAAVVNLLLKAGASVNTQAVCHTNLSGVSINDRTALHFACENRNLEMVASLLEFHADVNIKDKQFESPIHVAVRCRMCSIQCNILNLLCKNGSDVNSVNKIECPPLYLASFYGCVEKVSTLLLYGANVNTLCERESSYGTALHIAAFKDRYKLSETLISNGAKLNMINGLSYTPLHLNINAHSKSDVASLLIYHGSCASGVDKFHYTVLASVIRNMRFDCEVIAQMLVYAGYDLSGELWLNPPWYDCQSAAEDDTVQQPHVPIPSGRIFTLCEWLKQQQRNPLALGELCRITIRKHLSDIVEGSSVVPGIFTLPLPLSMKNYLALQAMVEI